MMISITHSTNEIIPYRNSISLISLNWKSQFIFISISYFYLPILSAFGAIALRGPVMSKQIRSMLCRNYCFFFPFIQTRYRCFGSFLLSLVVLNIFGNVFFPFFADWKNKNTNFVWVLARLLWMYSSFKYLLRKKEEFLTFFQTKRQNQMILSNGNPSFSILTAMALSFWYACMYVNSAWNMLEESRN